MQIIFEYLYKKTQADEMIMLSSTYYDLKALVVLKYHPLLHGLVIINLYQNENVYHRVKAW